ncbi:DUF2835 domain-containing protein [uncultured Paraglaciecola sp.]|uniref:DUF2835 domain-containing protein n=1 Tax=uncultured Paraglaciecola sp. TaxID=1765024 RepID=UPI00343F4D0C
MSKTYQFSLYLSAAKTESIYQGQVKYIIVETDQGIKLQLPAHNFRPFVNSNGIRGSFRLVTDDQNQLKKIEKI